MNAVVIKFCGMTRERDVAAAQRLGVDAVGFNFWRGSPRFVEPERAARLGALLAPGTERVGVFVDEPVEEIFRTAERAGLTVAQLHGDESPDHCAALEPLAVWKAVRVGPGFDPGMLARYPCDTFLLEGFSEQAPGGTGTGFDWARAREASAFGRIVLAGGLGPGNVAAAIEAAKPWAVDVASGIESGPGRKDPHRMAAFVEAVRKGGEGNG